MSRLSPAKPVQAVEDYRQVVPRGRPIIPEVEARQVMLDADLEPLEPYPGSSSPWQCRCGVCGEVVTPMYATVKAGGGCRVCSAKTRSTPSADAVAVMVAVGLEPLDPYPGASKPWRCRCSSCDAEVTPTYSRVRYAGSGCRLCGRKAAAASRRTSAAEAVEVMVAAGAEPLVDFPGVFLPWKCRCLTCGKATSSTLNAVKSGQGVCRHCAGKWDVEDNIAFMRECGFEPLAAYPGAHRPWRSRCTTCGAEVSPHFSTVKNHNGGCRACAIPGFDPLKAARLYFIHHPGFSAVKIGITGVEVIPDRVAIHQREGWIPIQVWDTPEGSQAEHLEARVLSWWRSELRAPQALTPGDMPQGGWTETAWLADVDPDETAAFIERLIAAD